MKKLVYAILAAFAMSTVLAPAVAGAADDSPKKEKKSKTSKVKKGKTSSEGKD